MRYSYYRNANISGEIERVWALFLADESYKRDIGCMAFWRVRAFERIHPLMPSFSLESIQSLQRT